MEKELNIAAILKDKPQGTKLYDWLYNIDIELDTISTTDTETVVWCTNETDNNTTCHRGYSEFGTVRRCIDGLQILLPSKEMRDWSKFAWKKGDVLVDTGFDNINCIFDAYISEDYTRFRARYCYRLSPCSNDIWFSNPTQIFSTKEFMKDPCPSLFIKKIEEHYKGKLNLETLEIEKQPEFKDGDILHSDETEYSDETIFIAKISGGVIGTYGYIDLLDESVMVRNDTFEESEINAIRLATDSEKQQLFDALAKEGKVWDEDKKQIENLKPKIELKPFDKVLSRRCSEDYWVLNFYSHKTDYYHICIDGSSNLYCIPYNDETKHLLGTTDEWKGGEG